MQAVSEGLVSRVKLWNRGDKVYNQEVNGDRYVIEPGQYMEMSRRTAINVRGKYCGRGVAVCLVIEPIMESGRDKEKVDVAEPVKIVVCPKCDKEFKSKTEYKDHYEAKHKRVRGKPAQRSADAVGNSGQGDDAE
jgi:uncharacterized C2H2 Zn-finger protein